MRVERLTSDMLNAHRSFMWPPDVRVTWPRPPNMYAMSLRESVQPTAIIREPGCWSLSPEAW